MTEFTVYSERIEELPGAGRLGRHVRRDSRSAAYPYQRRADTITAVEWARHAAILDQGNVGSCTGNAMTGAMAADPLYGALPVGAPALDEQLALRIYSEAETIDGDGPYPPNDNGSSGQSACHSARNHGWVSGYTWCQDLADMLDALQHGPVLLGVNWYSSFDRPDAQGVVSLPAGATIRGGHEIVCRAYDGSDLLWCDNSWGTGWGLQGRFAFPSAVLTRLFAEQGDCAVPLPVSAPAPQPVPVPDPAVHVDAADRALAAALPSGWAAARHAGSSGQAARAVGTWLAAKRLT